MVATTRHSQLKWYWRNDGVPMSGSAASAKTEPVQVAGKTLTRRAIQPTWFGPITGVWYWFGSISASVRSKSSPSVSRLFSKVRSASIVQDRQRMTGRMSLLNHKTGVSPDHLLLDFRQQRWHSEHDARNARTSQRRPRQKSWHHLLNISRPRKWIIWEHFCEPTQTLIANCSSTLLLGPSTPTTVFSSTSL
jgi:hypothetical protein